MYSVDFKPALPTGAGVAVTWASEPTGLTFSDESLLNTNTKAQARIAGGTAGITYTVSVIATSDESPTQVLETRPTLLILDGNDS